MGRFSTTVQIRNNVDKIKFVNTFSEIMKRRGFVTCSENEAVQLYLLAFSKGWVTLTSEEYNMDPQKAHDDTRDMAAALKTSAFCVGVVDSDFATLILDNGDCIIVGDGSGYGIEKPERGNREFWEQLFADGKTWEQFSEVEEKDSVFVEDTLCELADIFGIEQPYIYADYSEVLEIADGENVIALCFKPAPSL